MADKPEALTDAGLRIEMGGELGLKLLGNPQRLPVGRTGFGELFEASEASGGSAQIPCYIEEVAGLGARTQQCSSTGRRADEDDIDDGDGRLGKVAACERGFVRRGQCQQAVEEASHPRGRGGRGGPDAARCNGEFARKAE